MGGLIAVRAGRRNPGLFSGMVLEAPLAKFHADVTTAEYVVAKLAGWLLPTARSFRDPNEMLSFSFSLNNGLIVLFGFCYICYFFKQKLKPFFMLTQS